MADKVYIFDEIVVGEARFAELRQAYMSEYAPVARGRGMTLEGAWRSPPVELEGRVAVLHFLWSVPDVASWWRMRHGTEGDGDAEKTRWWNFVDSVAISRKRTFMLDIVEAGGNV